MVNIAKKIAQEIPSPIITSCDLDWETITVAEFKQPASNITLSPDSEHTLALCLANKPYRIHQALSDHEVLRFA